jgi:ankyrin repeat protein
MAITYEQFCLFRDAEMKEARDLASSYGLDISSPIEGSSIMRSPLMELCGDNSIVHREEKLKLLLELGADPNVVADFGGTPLMQAIRVGDGSDIVNILLDGQADVNLPDGGGSTALFTAVQYRKLDCLRTLIHRGGNINYKNNHGSTALNEEIRSAKSSVDIIKLLIELGSDINSAKSLHVAFEGWKSLHIAPLLINSGADVNAKNSDGRSPLSLAVSNKECPIDTITMLVNAGAVIDATDDKGLTPLMHAAKNGHMAAVKLLLELNASVAKCDMEGKNVLHWCCKGGYEKLIPLLVNAGAELNLQDGADEGRKSDGGRTPLMYAVRRGETTKTLLKFKPDVNVVDEKKRTALMHALTGYSDKKVDTVQKLLEKGAKVEPSDIDGNTVLHIAVDQYNPPDELVKLLVGANADLNAADSQGKTPLMVCRSPKVMSQLLKCGANINLVDKNQKTALIHCVSGYYSDVHQKVKILLNAKPNLDAKDSEGMTALMYAVRRDACTKTVKLMVDHGANLEILDNNGLPATGHASPDNLMLLIAAGAKPGASEGGKLLNAVYDDNLPLALILLDRGAKMKLKIEHFIKFKKIFEKLARANSGALRSGVICSDPDVQEQFNALLVKFGGNTDIADDSDLPEVLKRGAWLVKILERTQIILPANRISEIRDSIEYCQGSVQWPEGAKESILRKFYSYSAEKNQVHMGPGQTSQQEYLLGLINKKGAIPLAALFKNWAPHGDSEFIEFWNDNAEILMPRLVINGEFGAGPLNADQVIYLLARFDVAVLPGILIAQMQTRNVLDALRFVDAPGCASLMSKSMVSGSFARIARQWALRFPESCVKGLIVDAVSKLNKDRTAAEASLRFLASNGHLQVVERVASQFGDDVVVSISESLSQDHRVDYMPVKPPKMPKFWSADTYPSPRLKSNNKELPSYSIEALANMMSLSGVEVQIPALHAVIEACDKKSLANFAWAAFEEWAAKGQKDSEWIFDSLTYLGDDTCARKLTPYIRNWPRENGIARARKGLEILAAIGSDVALSQIQAISQKNKYQSVLESAQEMMKRIAVARDLKPDQLEDRLVPDFGLSEKGELKINYGSRYFIGSVDAQLKPVIKDATGAVIKALPAPGKDDDKALARESSAAWSDLCKELKPLAKLQLERLELAMVRSRRWSGSDFKTLFVFSPLLQNLVKGLLWGIFSSKGKLSSSFIVDGQTNFVDSEGRFIKLRDDASIGIVHPLLMDEAMLAVWQKIFAKNKQVQPFAQLVRKTFRAVDDKDNNRFGLDGATVASKALKSLLAMGWSTDVGDAGWISSFDRRFSSGYASLGAEPGVHISDYEMNSKEQKISVNIPDTLNPMEFSELVRELMTLKK